MQAKPIPAELIGVWSLVSYVATGSDGEQRFPSGGDPVRQLIYTADGCISALLMRRNRPRFASGDLMAGSAEEVRNAFEGFEAYAGTVEMDSVMTVLRFCGVKTFTPFPSSISRAGMMSCRRFRLDADYGLRASATGGF